MTPKLEDAYEAIENVQLGFWFLSCWLTSRKGYEEEKMSWLLLRLRTKEMIALGEMTRLTLKLCDVLLDLIDALELPR